MHDSLSWLDSSFSKCLGGSCGHFARELCEKGGFSVDNMQFSHLCTCVICGRSNAKGGQVMILGFFKAAVRFAYFVLALSKIRGLESPLEANLFSLC